MRISRARRHCPSALARTQATAGDPICSLTASSPAVLVPFSPEQPPGQASPQKQQHCTGAPHPWKRCGLYGHPEALNRPPPAEACITHPKPRGTVGLHSIPPAHKGFRADFWALTSPQIPPLQVKQRSPSLCTALYHPCCFNGGCRAGLSARSKPPK